jgi:hypothetical protein
MRRWTGLSVAVGTATAAAVTGSAWAGSTVQAAGAVPPQRAAPAEAHGCGHADTIAVVAADAAGGPAVAVRAVDGAGDPVDAAFAHTTLRVSIPGQRTRVAAVGAGAPAAEVRLALPEGHRGGTYELQAVATFDDGITDCSWTTRVAAPRT